MAQTITETRIDAGDYTQVVQVCTEPVLDEAGNPVLDAQGQPQVRVVWSITNYEPKPGTPAANQQDNQTSLDSLRATLLAWRAGTQPLAQSDLNVALTRFLLLVDAAARGDNSTAL